VREIVITCLKNGKRKQDSGFRALVDDAFCETVRWYAWSLNKGYPSRIVENGGKKTMLFLHQFVWVLAGKELPAKPLTLDHEDRNPLNNQIGNLRIASEHLQKVNQRLKKNNTSGYKGVVYHKKNRNWIASIMLRPKRKHLGSFDTKE
jgi:HNH endonuclease